MVGTYGRTSVHSQSLTETKLRKMKGLQAKVAASLSLTLIVSSVNGFLVGTTSLAKTSCRHEQQPRPLYDSSSSSAESQTTDAQEQLLDSDVAEKFKIVTCMSTSCSKKRKALNMDPLSTYGAFFDRIENGAAPDVQLEEGPCLGSCKMAPCVAIEHEDYVGTVALEGMTEREFQSKV